MEIPKTLDGNQWIELLERIASHLAPEAPPVTLCLIGSSACLFAGMDARTSRDLDIWRPLSDYDRKELREAAEAAGVLFDPRSALDPDRPYLQIVDPGVVEIGDFEPIRIDRIGRLILLRPPVENLIASKLIRGDSRDVSDILFLVNHFNPDLEEVRKIVLGFSSSNRDKAVENLVYLDLIAP